MSINRKLIVTSLVVAFVGGCDLVSRTPEYKIEPINTLPDTAFFLMLHHGACDVGKSLGIWGDLRDFPSDDDPAEFASLNPGQTAFFQLLGAPDRSDRPVQTYCGNTTTNGNNWPCPGDMRYFRVSRGLRHPGFVLHCYADVKRTNSDLALITSTLSYQDEYVKHCPQDEATTFHDVARGLRAINAGQVLGLTLPITGIGGMQWFCGGVEQPRFQCPPNSVVGLVTRSSFANFVVLDCFL